MVKVTLISTYELGHQPFGLASPVAWLERAGAAVTTLDLAVEPLAEDRIAGADLVAFYVPMHTASRIASTAAKKVQEINPTAYLCFYGLYAPVNESFFRKLGVHTLLGGEFEAGLVALAQRVERERSAPGDGTGLDGPGGPGDGPQPEPLVSVGRQRFVTPNRSKLPPLERYAWLEHPDGTRHSVGYTEATRGCKHLCRHCPIVPVYEGRFRVVQRDVVLDDVRQQVAAGAQHITFGDPDFFNGPEHALRIVQQMHEEFPALTYDATIKIEHLINHAEHLPALRDTGCLFVTSAVESIDDTILEYFDKRHTRDDFVEVVKNFREVGLTLSPTFVTFTPWTTLRGYAELLELIADLDLVPNVAPIQYAIRLLIPAGSKLLELPEVQELVGDFDEAGLCYRWTHPDPRVDRLFGDVFELVQAQPPDQPREDAFRAIRELAQATCGGRMASTATPVTLGRRRAAAVPRLSEPWYCCSEPTEQQLDSYGV